MSETMSETKSKKKKKKKKKGKRKPFDNENRPRRQSWMGCFSGNCFRKKEKKQQKKKKRRKEKEKTGIAFGSVDAA